MKLLPNKPIHIRITIILTIVVFCISFSAGLLNFFLTRSLVSRQNLHSFEHIVKLAMAEAKAGAEKAVSPDVRWKKSVKGNLFIFNATGEMLWVSDKKLHLALNQKIKDSLQAVDLEMARTLFQASKEQVLTGYKKDSASTAADAMLHVFLPENKILLHSAEQGMYALGEVPENYFSSLSLFATIFILTLLISALVTVSCWQLCAEISESLVKISRGIEVESLKPEAIDSPYSEIQELARVVSDNLQFSGSLPQGKDSADVLQKKLFEKPFARLKKFEVIVFPKSPNAAEENFVSAAETNGRLQFFLGRFDVQEIETQIHKHRLQERLMALSRHAVEPAQLAEDMWASLFQHVDLGPGMLYIDADPAKGTLHYFRSGPYYVYGIGAGNEQLSDGDTFFSSRFSGFSSHKLMPGSAILVVSKETAEAADLSVDDLLPLMDNFSNGKKFLANLLEKLHKRLTDGNQLPGIITLIVSKA